MYMMTFVNLNITSESELAKVSMGLRYFSATITIAIPKMMENTTTWRISPLAIDLAIFSGKT